MDGVTPRHPAEDPERIATLRGEELLDTPSEAAFDRLTRVATRLLGVPIALVSLVDADRQFFKSSVGLPADVDAKRETPLSHSFCKYVTAAGEPLIVADAREDPQLRDNPAIRDLGVIAFAGFPLYAGSQPIGSFCAIDSQPHDWSAEEIELVHDLAAMAQAQLDLRALTRAARAGQEQARREQAGAEAASDVLRRLVAVMDAARDAGGLDALLDDVVRSTAVALEAPAAVVGLVGADGRLHSRATAGLGEAAALEPLAPGEGFAGAVLHAGRVLAVPDLAAWGEPASAQGLVALGLTAALGASLRVHGRPTGVLLVADRRYRSFTELESQLLRLCAERLASSIERARIADEERDVADRLQRALEPTRLPRFDGLRLAARYRPAELRIGGDWYDAFDLPGNRAGLVIGDVVGHGIRAAAAAVRLRHFLRGFVLEGMGPGEVLGALDRLVADEPDAAFSSVVYAELDLGAGTARWASAGHLPPVLLRGGAVTTLDPAGGSLLGVAAADPWPERSDGLEPGDRLVLYTDGLVERPGVPIDEDIAATFGAVAAETDVERLCQRLVTARDRPRRDDVAVLAAQIT